MSATPIWYTKQIYRWFSLVFDDEHDQEGWWPYDLMNGFPCFGSSVRKDISNSFWRIKQLARCGKSLVKWRENVKNRPKIPEKKPPDFHLFYRRVWWVRGWWVNCGQTAEVVALMMIYFCYHSTTSSKTTSLKRPNPFSTPSFNTAVLSSKMNENRPPGDFSGPIVNLVMPEIPWKGNLPVPTL